MALSRLSARAPSRGAILDFLSFDRMITSSVTHLIYWCGLAVIFLSGFGVVGASIGLAIREASLEGLLIAIPALVAGLLTVAALALIWRGVCEFFVAIFQIAEDLRAIRLSSEGQGGTELGGGVRASFDRRPER